MKRIVCLLAIAALWVLSFSFASAETMRLTGVQPETIRLGSEITIEDVCSFTVKAVKEYNVFMNQHSGNSKQFLVVSFDIINWMTEPLFIKTQSSAALLYDESFEYEAEFLWSNPGGSYADDIYVFDMDELGEMTYIREGKCYHDKCGYMTPHISSWSRVYNYNPVDDAFIHSETRRYAFNGSSKTVLDPLVKRTMHYVFRVPDLVAKDEGLRVLTLSINGQAYEYTF